jgi:hypothetical protein
MISETDRHPTFYIRVALANNERYSKDLNFSRPWRHTGHYL